MKVISLACIYSDLFSTLCVVLCCTVVLQGFEEEEKEVVEGEPIRVCVDVLNVTFQNNERFAAMFQVSTVDGTARGKKRKASYYIHARR